MRCDECTKYAEVCHVCEPVRKLESIIEANGAKPTLSEVLAKIVTKSEKSIEFSDSAGDLCAVIRVSDVKEILSEYFA